MDRYALDVNVERAEDVITHKRVLQMAEDPDNRPAFDVRLVQVNMLLKIEKYYDFGYVGRLLVSRLRFRFIALVCMIL